MPTTVLQEKKRWTYDAYLNLPDDLNIYEIINGELHMAPAPTPKHQKVSLNLVFLLKRYINKHRPGEIFEAPIDVLLDPHTVVQPDIIFISKENLSIITEKNIQGLPKLVIEILSPGTIQKDRITKMGIYARFGVKHFWLIDPDNQTLEAFEIDKKNYRLTAALKSEESFNPSLFPNLTISLKKLWE